jgi:hypothetical protein
MATTVNVRGEGGYVFEMDVPAEGTAAREVYDDAIAKGRLTIVPGEHELEPEQHDEQAREPAQHATKAAPKH